MPASESLLLGECPSAGGTGGGRWQALSAVTASRARRRDPCTRGLTFIESGVRMGCEDFQVVCLSTKLLADVRATVIADPRVTPDLKGGLNPMGEYYLWTDPRN